jgi:hypothetical protein
LDRLPLAGTLRNVLPEVTHQVPSRRPKRSICTSSRVSDVHPDAPIWLYPHDATARRSGADDLCSRSGAFRVFVECARSADLARQVWWPDAALLTIASALDRHFRDATRSFD